MPTVPPSLILAAVVLLTLGVGAVTFALRGRERRALRELAVLRRWAYAPGDALELSRRLGPRLPVVGAAAVRVTDVMRRPNAGRLVFRVDYSLGSVRHRRNVTRVAACRLAGDGEVLVDSLAAPEGSLNEQFAQLLDVEEAV